MKNKIEVGQKVYVTTRNAFIESPPNLHERMVVKVNGSSFYTRYRNADVLDRFDIKTMKCDTGMGTIKEAYLNDQDYWDKIALIKEKKALVNKVSKSLNSLDVDVLKKILEVIEGK